MRLLILGSNGQVGHCLVEKASNKGFDFCSTNSCQLDITDYSKVAETFNSVSPTIVVNATAYTNVEKAEEEQDKAFKVNSLAVGNLAKLCAERDVPFIHISTDYVFDGTKDGYYREDDAVNPINVYGKSKLSGELAIANNSSKFIILRTSWVFGRHGKNFVKTMINLFKSKSVLTVVNDQVGGPTYAGDIASSILAIAENLAGTPDFSEWGVYNYSGKDDVSWYDFAKSIYLACKNDNMEVNDLDIRAVSASDFKTKAIRPQNSKLCLDKIKSVFGIKESDWRREINDNIRYYN